MLLPSPLPPASDELDSILYNTTDTTALYWYYMCYCTTTVPLTCPPHSPTDYISTLPHNGTQTSVNTHTQTCTKQSLQYTIINTLGHLFCFLWVCLTQPLHVHVSHVWKVQPMQCLCMAHTTDVHSNNTCYQTNYLEHPRVGMSTVTKLHLPVIST